MLLLWVTIWLLFFFFLGFQGQGAGAVPTGAADAFMGRPEIDAQPRGVDGPMGEYGRSATTGKPGPLPSYQTFSSETSRMVYSERRSDPVDPLSLSENRSVMCHPGSWSEQSSSQQSVASVSRTSNMGQVMTNNVRKKYCNLIPCHRLNFPTISFPACSPFSTWYDCWWWGTVLEPGTKWESGHPRRWPLRTVGLTDLEGYNGGRPF